MEQAPGVVNRGILDHQLREVTISALPTAIPESLVIDISWMDLGDTFLLNRVETPEVCRSCLSAPMRSPS